MEKLPSLHSTRHPVMFGDCDPAGIAYYPNIFRWIDGTFHDWLRGFGGHAALCERLGATGLGLMDVQARFRAPLRDGDRLEVRLLALDWGTRSLTLRYEGHVGARIAFEAVETRGVFVNRDGRLKADTMDGLRAMVGG